MKLSDKIVAAIERICTHYDGGTVEFLSDFNDLNGTAVANLSNALHEIEFHYCLYLVSIEDACMIEVAVLIPFRIFGHLFGRQYDLLISPSWTPDNYSLQELVQKLLTFEKEAREILTILNTLQ